MGKKVGHLCKVTVGANKVVGVGTWTMGGISSDQLEATEMADYWKTYEFGLKDGGTITFNGLFDPADTNGQVLLRAANLDATDVTDLRLYVDLTSFFRPCHSTSYWSPTNTSAALTFPSWVNIVSYEVSADKGGMMMCSFTAKVTGNMAYY